MYIRSVHAEVDPAKLHTFIRAHPLGVLTTAIPHPSIDTLQSTHIPWVLDVDDEDSNSGLGTEAGAQSNGESAANGNSANGTDAPPNARLGRLRGHMARANPQTRAMVDALKSTSPSCGGSGVLASDALILFTAPVHAYVTPRWMVATKADSGKVTPTWEFAAVQVYGRVRVYGANDAVTSDFLDELLDDLTVQMEATVPGEAWGVDDAPRSYNERLKKGIVGLEVEVTKIQGRFKLGQDETDGDYEGIVRGFRGTGTGHGEEMARMMETRGAGRPGCPKGTVGWL